MAQPDAADTPIPTHAARPWLLWALAALAVAALAGLNRVTEARIAQHAERAQAARIADVLIGLDYDNEPLADALRIEPAGSATMTAYRARVAGVVVGVALTVTAPRGYQGPIDLLVGIAADGRVLGLRVLRQTETPGLGAEIAVADSPWSRQFAGRSRQDTPAETWSVRRDGGRFDQLTGATVSSRAVVAALQEALLQFEARQAVLLETAAAPEGLPQ